MQADREDIFFFYPYKKAYEQIQEEVRQNSSLSDDFPFLDAAVGWGEADSDSVEFAGICDERPVVAFLLYLP